GLAKNVVSDSDLTQSGQTLGTPAYISPEQVNGETVDGRSDIYSLGAVLYEMLVGDRLFRADNSFALLMKHLNEPPPNPLEKRPGLSSNIVNVLFKMLAKKPEERHQSADELIRDLESVPRQAGIDDPDEHTPSLTSIKRAEDHAVLTTPLTLNVIEKPKNRTKILVAGMAGTAVLVLLAGTVLFFLWKGQGKQTHDDGNASAAADPGGSEKREPDPSDEEKGDPGVGEVDPPPDKPDKPDGSEKPDEPEKPAEPDGSEEAGPDPPEEDPGEREPPQPPEDDDASGSGETKGEPPVPDESDATPPVDTTPPAAVTDLRVREGTRQGTAILTWTATGDDGYVGTAMRYVVKFSTTRLTGESFDRATSFPQAWKVLPAGEEERHAIDGLTPGRKYFFAVKAQDEVGNTSDMSNAAGGIATPDNDRPASIMDLKATTGSSAGTILLAWTASGDDEKAGQATSYVVKYSTSPISDAEFDRVSAFPQGWKPLAAGKAERHTIKGLNPGWKYFFAVRVRDEAGNASALSNVVHAVAARDTTPLPAIRDLKASKGASSGTVLLTWTAVGGDRTGRRAGKYVVKYSTSRIDKNSFESSPEYSQRWQPRRPGERERRTVEGLTPGITYYFAVKIEGTEGNRSAMSNVASETLKVFVIAIAAGINHSIALSNDGRMKAWGSNKSGQLGGEQSDSWGNWDDEGELTPVPVSKLQGVTAISTGDNHTIAVKKDGTGWAWGSNGHGRLGIGSTTNQFAPVRISGLEGLVAVAGGGFHTLALMNDGTVWAWGVNKIGQLGDGTREDRHRPVRVSKLQGTAGISAGFGYSMAVREDGTVWTWGSNKYSQLGEKKVTFRTAPNRVSSLTGMKSVSAGKYHAAALKDDGTVWTWGWNKCGQLGNGSADVMGAPARISRLASVVRIAAGGFHTIALKDDGTVWTWGINQVGQLGDGTRKERRRPIRVPNLERVVSIAAGYGHSMALKEDGSVWAWGRNDAGQLGDGTKIDRLKPVQVLK
ncbi:MAG: RCC1 domain-containing protein, partial [Planctomycetota bacterium]